MTNPYQYFWRYYRTGFVLSLLSGFLCVVSFPINNLEIPVFGLGYITSWFVFVTLDRFCIRLCQRMNHVSDEQKAWVLEHHRLDHRGFMHWATVWTNRRWIACLSTLSVCFCFALLGKQGGTSVLFASVGTVLYPLIHAGLWVKHRKIQMPYVESETSHQSSNDYMQREMSARIPGTPEWFSYGRYMYGSFKDRH